MPTPPMRGTGRTMEFLHAGEIGVAEESLMQMREAHDQQRDEQRNKKSERETEHEG